MLISSELYHRMKKIFISVGEASGDKIGAKLISAFDTDIIKQYYHSSFNIDFEAEFYGIGGDVMNRSNFNSIFHCNDIAVMGFVEIISSIPHILSKIKQAYEAVIKIKPDIIVTIDSPGFNMRLVDKIRKYYKNSKINAPNIIHYVSPTLWAYKVNRKRKYCIEDLYDKILLLFPFEKSYYNTNKVTVVGHPVIEEKKLNSESAFKLSLYDRHDIFIVIMPGSRYSEIKRHAKTLANFMINLKQHYSTKKQKINFLIPAITKIERGVCKIFKRYLSKDIDAYNDIIISSDTDTIKKFYDKSHLAVVKSGTAVLELMLYNIPIISFYKVNPLTAFFLRRALKIKYVTICNIILNKCIIPEMLQENFNTNALMTKSIELLEDQEKCKLIVNNYKKVFNALGAERKHSPSIRAAKAIIDCVYQNSINL